MTSRFDIEDYPLLKLALPLIAGIVIGWQCDVDMLHVAALFVVAFLAVGAGLFRFAPRWLFGAGAVGVMLAVGLFSVTCERREAQPRWGKEKLSCEAQLLEVPYMGAASTRALAYVTARGALPGERSEGVVNIYFANSVEAEALRVGERLLFEAVIKNPANAGNPAEFDVERYMRVKGVCGSLYLPVEGWESVGLGSMTLRMRALALRERVVRMYESLGFEGNNLSLLSAFSVGEKRGFPQLLRDAYADAGTSHILALSGLHLGVFYMVLVWLLGFMRGGRALFVLRELVVVVLLWGFAFVAGLTASVVRAAVLFTAVSLGRSLRRDGSTLNSLALAALLMLLWSPRLLFDVSFQLSFSAVLAIVLLIPPLQDMLRWEKGGKVYKIFISAVGVSLVAQVGVLPFVWYYFGTFPLYFILANLLLVPLAALLMFATVLLWVATPVALLQQVVAWLLSWLLVFMNGVVEFVASLPCASLLLPRVGVAGACCAALLLALLFGGIVRRRWWVVGALSVVATLLLVLNIFAEGEKQPGDYIMLFNNRKSAAVLAVDGRGCYALSSVPQLDADVAVMEPFLERERLGVARWVEQGDTAVSYNGGLLSFAGVRLQLLADDCWLSDSVSRPVDAVLLCRGYLGSVKELLVHYPTNCVILDGSLYESSRRRILREAAFEGVATVDIEAVGAVRIKGGEDAFAVETMRGK